MKRAPLARSSVSGT